MRREKYADDDDDLTVDAENATAPGAPTTPRTPTMTIMGRDDGKDNFISDGGIA